MWFIHWVIQTAILIAFLRIFGMMAYNRMSHPTRKVVFEKLGAFFQFLHCYWLANECRKIAWSAWQRINLYCP